MLHTPPKAHLNEQHDDPMMKFLFRSLTCSKPYVAHTEALYETTTFDDTELVRTRVVACGRAAALLYNCLLTTRGRSYPHIVHASP